MLRYKSFIIIFLLHSCKMSFQTFQQGYLKWESPSQLKYSDFQASFDKKRKYSSRVYSDVVISQSISVDSVTKLPKCYTLCHFIKKKSFLYMWASEGLGLLFDEPLFRLRQAQVHFNICELSCRKIRKGWDSLNSLGIKRTGLYQKIFAKEMKRVIKKRDAYQKSQDDKLPKPKRINGKLPVLKPIIYPKYLDSILVHWEEKINVELVELQDYKDNTPDDIEMALLQQRYTKK